MSIVNKMTCSILIARGEWKKELCELCPVRNKVACSNKENKNAKRLAPAP